MTPETPAKVTATTLPDEPERKLVVGAERLEATRANSEFWFNAGNKEPDHDRAVLYVANAMFAWRNAAYGLSTQLTTAIAERDALLQSFNAERLRAELAEKLGMRICRDLRHAIDEIADGNEAKALMRTRHAAFEKMIGDTSNYRHELHASIDAANERAEAMDKALTEIAVRAEGNAKIQESVGHGESARAWAHCATKARAATDTAIEQGAQHG